jgi:hypothetical protein
MIVLSGRGGIGRVEGGHGSKSKGDPFNAGGLLCSPKLFQTRAVGHSMVRVWNFQLKLY